MRRALAERGVPDVPVRAVPLAHRFSDAAAEGWPAALADLREKPFVLCVGTIESRKNHLALFQAWKLLLEEGMEPPPLVCVGRPGWRVGDLLAQLEATGFLGGRIRLLHGISDPELASLYRSAAFSVFPSFTEGWGLPVGESLALGTPCLASHEGATPEAASGFAPPLDPYSPRAIAAAVRCWTEDPEELARERTRIAEGFRPRDWDDVGRDFRRAFEECLNEAPPGTPAAAPALAEGADLGFPALAALLGPGFEPPSGDVAWVAGRAAALRISAPPGRLVLSLAARPWAGDNRVALDDAPSLPLSDGMALSLDWPGGEGTVRLRLSGPLDAAPDSEDARPVRMGLRRLALLPEGAPRLARGRAVAPGDATLWAALAPGRDTLTFRPEAPVGERIHLLLGVAGEEAPRRHFLLPGEDGVVRLPLDGARPVFLAWAAESDLAGRLALLEAHPAALPLAERIAALEGAEDAPLPPGEAGRWARRLAG
nr:glycosyltransferase [Roseococcus sp. MDT2-1-1]